MSRPMRWPEHNSDYVRTWWSVDKDEQMWTIVVPMVKQAIDWIIYISRKI